MRRITLAAFVGVVLFAALAMGCLDRKPAPVCPVPTEIVKNEKTASDFDGVDLLVSVDNSGSMAEEQEILSTGFFTLVNSLTRPLSPENDPGWGFPPVNNMRVAIVSSDMGLQWGEEFENGVKVGGRTGGNTTDVAGCGNNKGEDGTFLGPRVTTIEVESGQIKCEEGGGQCPEGFDCNNDFVCEASGGVGTVNCPDDTPAFVETTAIDENRDLTTQVACMAQQGTEGCGVEQQLEAAVRGLENYTSTDSTNSFLVDSHLLAVLVVSDEEDCSIRDNGLFNTDAWESGSNEFLNTACNHPEDNETFLFPANANDVSAIANRFDVDEKELQTYYNRFVAMKDGKAAAVIFAAIVGVPYEDDDPTCQADGLGLVANECLEHNDMEIRVETFVIPETDQEYNHFTPACVRTNSAGVEVTSARPGRRFVKVAQDFGRNGYVYSICNEDWSPAMRTIAEIIARQITPTCYDKQLDWELAPTNDCSDCGVAKCDVVVEYQRSGADLDDHSCPDQLYAGLSQAEASALRQRKDVEEVKADDGTVVQKIVHCPLPKLATPIDCNRVEDHVDQNDVGWYYCEKSGENFDNACADGIDNDDDNENGILNDPDDLVDCDDPDCEECVNCGGTGVNCEAGCRFGVEITDAAKNAAIGQYLSVLCLSRFRFEDTNCQEDTRRICRNNKDDDGNGVMDCVNTFENPDGNKPHLPDSYCCPMEVDENGNCDTPDRVMNRIINNCLTDSDRQNKTIDSRAKFWRLIAVGSEDEATGSTPYIKELDACRARISELECKTQ
jgi:hypothetical protein